jgi:RNA recognition motif-containing protein
MGTRLYVGNLPRGANEAILRMAFGQDRRTVTDVTINMDAKTGRLQQFGIVDMATHEDAQAAMDAWHGKDLDGRNLTVNW